MTHRGQQPEISVILPVYNVGAYLDLCMESLEEQTFPDMEILLINDGSTDDSSERCRSWAQRDSRVRYFEKENEGVAAARNLGAREARGKYLAFVDPDDWLAPTYLEKLHDRLEETGGVFAECDLWRYDNRSGKKIYRSCGSRMGVPYTLREHMKYGPTATYKSLFRKSFWEKWDIHIPSCSFESPAIYALLVALSGGVESVPEALYYYRRFRENSLIENGYAAKDGAPNHTLGMEAMDFLVAEFKRCGIYEQYRDTLEGVVKYRLSDILAMQFHRKQEKDFRILAENYRRFLDRTFPAGLNEPYITWGGYNLNRILTHMNWLHDPYTRFNFSGMIAVTEPRTGTVPGFRHRNRYRQIMLERERTQRLWDILSELQPKWFFLDLMEERFDMIQTEAGFFTASDAWEGAENRPDGRRIANGSPEWSELWEKSAAKFVERVKATVPGIRFVIVESLLSSDVGDISQREPYPNQEEIRKQNEVLRRCYIKLEEFCPEALVIRRDGEKLYFTDRKYEYGAIPSHLNELFNQHLAAEIELQIKKKVEE